MHSSSSLTYGAVALVALIAAPVSAANPKLSLRLEQVTCRQAVDALAKATGLPVELREIPGRPDAPPDLEGARLSKRANFDWTNTRLAKALRDLCREYDLVVNRFSGAYTLMPSPVAPPAPGPKPRGLVEKDGVRIYPSSLSVSSDRSINFEREGEPRQTTHLSLGLRVEWPDGDPETIAGFDNVVARDDLGNVLEYQRRPSAMEFGGFDFGGRFPDEWSGNVGLQDPHPRARKLQWIEGELLVYKVYRPFTLEVPISEKSNTGIVRAGQTQAEILGVDSNPPGGGGPVVRARLFLPRSENTFSSLNGRMFAPTLVGASGKTYFSRGGGSNGNGGTEGTTFTLNLTYPRLDEPIVKAVFSLVEKGEPQKLLSFRMTDIAFPPDGVFVPRRQAQQPVRPMAAPKPERPFYEAGGGTLVLRTEIIGKAAGEGGLSVGLAPKVGADAGAVRWQEAEVDKEGVARLRDVKPGVYRLLRVYRPKATTVVEGQGHWENGEAEVALVAGKETTVAPLRWTLEGRSSVPSIKPLPGKTGARAPKKPSGN